MTCSHLGIQSILKIKSMIQQFILLPIQATFLILAKCFLLTFLFVTQVNAQSADPNDPTSPNYKGKLKTYEKKFSGSAGISFGTGFDEFSESFGVYNFSGNYALGTSSITVNAEYSHPLDGDTENARRWAFEDLDIVWNAPALKPLEVRGQKINLVPRINYRAPISTTSIDASSYGAITTTLIGSTNMGRFTFILSPRLTFSHFGFETADKNGFEKNVPFAATMVGAIRMTVLKNLFLTTSAFYYSGWDYSSNSVPISGASGNIYYQLNQKVGLTAFAGWRDRVFTNNSLFDDDTSNMGLGVITSF